MLVLTATSHVLILLLVKHHLFHGTATTQSDHVFEDCFLPHSIISGDLVSCSVFLHIQLYHCYLGQVCMTRTGKSLAIITAQQQ